MRVYFVLSIDGDWGNYFASDLPREKRLPDKAALLDLVGREIGIGASLGGKFLHFIHTSPVTQDFFLQPEFIRLWKEIMANGGSVGIHCHDEDLAQLPAAERFAKREALVRSLTQELRRHGLDPVSYRGGYLAFSEKNIPILERNGLFLDFSCDPGRYLVLDGRLIADWRDAPGNYYQMAYEDHRKPGTSHVTEIPLGKAGGGSLYIDTKSLFDIWKAAKTFAKRVESGNRPIVVNVLTHTYELASFWKRLKIRLALWICKKYGRFINDRQALQITDTAKAACGA